MIKVELRAIGSHDCEALDGAARAIHEACLSGDPMEIPANPGRLGRCIRFEDLCAGGGDDVPSRTITAEFEPV